jgi:hypothetical protein
MPDYCDISPKNYPDGGTSSVSNVPALPLHCPLCGIKGKRVDTLTVKALLAISLAAIRPGSYRFCATPDCLVVYYTEEGEQVFTETELRERVYQKSPQDRGVLVCYCFYHTLRSIRAELLETGSSTIAEQITAGIEAGACACDIRNPQGSCCLGNVRTVVKRLTAELELLAAD